MFKTKFEIFFSCIIIVSGAMVIAPYFACGATEKMGKRDEKYFIGKTTIGDRINYKELKSHTYTLKTKGYTAVIRDNDVTGREGFNGIAILKIAGSKKNIFAPKLAGMNFESINSYGGNGLEPRTNKIKLRQISVNTVELYQPPTKVWGVESSTRFTASSDKTLDITFGFIAHKRKYLDIVFANYINNPPNKNIYFVGNTPDNPKIRWLEATQPDGDSLFFLVRDLSPKVKWAAEYKKNKIYERHSAKKVKLLKWRRPIFYGILDNNVVFICMVKDKIVGLGYHLDGGGKDIPAWDIILLPPLVKNTYVKPNVYFKFDIRLVVKKFVSRENIIAEYNSWIRE